MGIAAISSPELEDGTSFAADVLAGAPAVRVADSSGLADATPDAVIGFAMGTTTGAATSMESSSSASGSSSMK